MNNTDSHFIEEAHRNQADRRIKDAVEALKRLVDSDE